MTRAEWYRREDWKHVVSWIEDLEFFRRLHDQDYFSFETSKWTETIKLLDARIKLEIKEYERKWGVKLHRGLLKRSLCG